MTARHALTRGIIIESALPDFDWHAMSEPLDLLDAGCWRRPYGQEPKDGEDPLSGCVWVRGSDDMRYGFIRAELRQGGASVAFHLGAPRGSKGEICVGALIMWAGGRVACGISAPRGAGDRWVERATLALLESMSGADLSGAPDAVLSFRDAAVSLGRGAFTEDCVRLPSGHIVHRAHAQRAVEALSKLPVSRGGSFDPLPPPAHALTWVRSDR